ncbi:hypothetical protein FIV42_12275 [Persicimonas caeni]|uniref:Right handed beta helix domain-containing protein n=1 Tax=Persicimonas caeni TaxID=2292766 RepID=A0A4Y6PT47_PERCE|nr:right-handed parallel beta-helix repeat-containing protein [Persicimonas caeni]QDG51492.1 hypothetical protein FIV42_12275 [Persicimonas caeni]QED32713.1 hypothetical protein FRD00_12270 [Persicimonas caeni]
MPTNTRAAIILAIVTLAVGCSDDSSGEQPSPDAADAAADTASDTTLDASADASDTVSDTTSDTVSDTMSDASTATCALPAPFDHDPAYPIEVWVSPVGDNTNAGTREAPFATLEHAASTAVQGTRIHLMAGTYSGGIYLDNLQGTAEAPVAIVGEEGAVIDGGNTGLQVSDPSYLTIENLTIRNVAQNGLNIDDGGSFDTPAHHVVVRNVTVEGVGDGGNQDCIKLSGVDDFWVLDNDVSQCSGQGIDMVGCHDGVIHGNHIHDKPSSGIQAKGGTADILIHGNRFADVTGRGINAGGSTGLAYFRPQDAPYEGVRIRVVANVFERVGAASGAPMAYVGCDACVFAHNTVIEPKTWVARILQESTDERFVPSRDGLFVNNIVVFNTADLRNGVFVNVGGNTAPETFTFANNLWFALDDPNFSGPSLSGGIPAPQDSIVQQEPGFADRAGGDYRIGTDSPAVGAARTLSGEAFPDYDGRCFDDPAAVGAFAAQ